MNECLKIRKEDAESMSQSINLQGNEIINEQTSELVSLKCLLIKTGRLAAYNFPFNIY